ncbi:FMN-dependent NADH-azoreductase [Subtercola boreus]|uniref:FMN dependent NADH:quinone oxidoreductase n=1 Tax=Subtercola boreus TaxID=120213 RepID=A0A3E0WGC7_9MICO|nr:NAD(P)H-dependent oxidoreductase [Subtercola boreus]RFA23551.1 FMN-dependent NADH-azoreductase [Subtercola boreus]RFA23945.1 FMN-dependent NADH-azoreductase [Subtercola boreus]RFA29643.1 FMN-dependent NADH-azoreductase [Subtercola boreus]
MAHLLHLDSSADLERSRSRAIGRTFEEAWLNADPSNTITHRDLHVHPVPHLADASLHWPARLRPAGSNPPAEAEALQTELLEELIAADVLVVGAPLYNYSLPSTLKAWIDHIHVPAVTAPFDVDTQPMKGKPAVILSSRGAVYDAGTPTADWDHEVPALSLILGAALGMEITVIQTSLTLADTVEALAPQLDRSNAELAAAHAAARDTATRLGAPTA